jgi:hypothetical protein
MRAAVICGVFLLVAAVSSAKNVRDYDKLTLNSPPLRNGDLLRRVRGFIDSHWTHHRRGHLTYTLHNGSDEPITGGIHIDASTDGMWHIRASTHSVTSGRLVHSVGAVSFRYWGRICISMASRAKMWGRCSIIFLSKR